MSRRAFRETVEAPRPAAAWLLVTVASATLWITQHLDPWVMVAQALFILGSLARRENPHPWQRSPIALNVGMFGIVGVTITVALRGGPSTIALAHFAALTQGLQLFDSRPRRTEFMLVALALFQVILASNLTDSVFFPPLLIAFVFAAVWTLLVHTLRSEANEAGERAAVPRALTPGLTRVTLLASGVSVLLALALFVTLPRLRSSVVTGAGIGAVVATSGFSDRVELGTIGRIRQDSTVVLRVETLEGEAEHRGERYWRGLAFDAFDGRAWSVTSGYRARIPGSPEVGITLGVRPDRVNLVQRIVREPVEAGVLFGMGNARRFQGTVRRVERDVNGGLYAAGQANERIRYTLSSEELPWSDRTLRRDLASPPVRSGDRYLTLPPFSPAVAALAREITQDATNDADRMRSLERYLVEKGRYTDEPPVLDADDPTSPVEAFLFGDLAGHCEYFASALVVLARSLGMPTRMVNGFAGGRRNRIGDFIEVARADAHTWVELHYERAGWVRYDATPADLRVRPALSLSFDERVEELASALELWWFQSVVGFDRADQMRALKSAWVAWRGVRSNDRPSPPGGESDWSQWKLDREVPWRAGALGAALCAALVVAGWRLRRGRSHSGVHAAYASALRLLARRGLVREPAIPARDFARLATANLPDPAARAFHELTEVYLAERFGGRIAPRSRPLLQELREGLRS